ncbi:uncharacterized protein LOC132276691 isoform X2 [Cornus florida]|uniref:uncharacterized protein LOC132276691 isoform X2 n=1 Tax=Cornus florida TaxID=4283 RepID=UPI00289B8561|nr:uncharacterized protein LOC132276691 isoform X2 [Cornus florida]
MSTIHPFIALVREGRYNLPQWYTMLPLGEIVEYVSYNFEWSPKDSIYKLILMFCLPEMQKRWETLRLRLLNTSDNGVRQLIFHYAQEGKIIHLAALLLIDPPHFDRSASLGKDHSIMHKLTTIEMARQLVATKMVSLIVEDQKLTGRSNKLIQKKRLMMSVLALLEICERIGVEMEYLVSGSHVIYTQSSNRAESMAELLVFMFKDSGFPVTNELEVFKHMNCFLDEPQGNVSGELWGFTFEKDPYYPLYNKFESPAVIDNRRARMQLGQQRRSISTHSLREKPGLCSLVQSFCMSQRFNTRFSPKFCTNTEAQTRKTFQVIRKHVPGLVLSQKISSFLSAIKRGI